MAKFDLSQDSEGQDFSAMPPGKYMLVCTDAEVRETKAGDGAYFNLKFEVAAPEKFKGRTVFGSYNFKNKSADAVRIGREQLKRFMMSAGKSSPECTFESVTELCGLAGMASIGVDEKGYNKVKTFIIGDGETSSFDDIESASTPQGKVVETKKPAGKPAQKASW